MGKGLVFDPTRYFIFCANVLGSPYGSSSPVSANPHNPSTSWGPEFPATTTRDDIRAQLVILRQHFGVESVAAVIGGSMGGMAVLEWPLVAPKDFVKNIVPIATSGRHSAWGISWGETQRQSIYSDPKYEDGFYSHSDPPSTGLAAARMAALLTYRTQDSFESRFGRKAQEEPPQKSAREEGWDAMPRTPGERALAAHNNGMKRSTRSRPGSPPQGNNNAPPGGTMTPTTSLNINKSALYDPLPRSDHKQPLIFSAQSYLRYQGDKFVARFDANCYISITRKMDTHDLARPVDKRLFADSAVQERPPWPDVLELLPRKTLLIAISSDSLFTLAEMQGLSSFMPEARLEVVKRCGFFRTFVETGPSDCPCLLRRSCSPDGHDGFLLEFEQINKHVLGFLQERLPSIYEGEPLMEWGDQNGDFKVTKTSVFGEAEADVSRW